MADFERTAEVSVVIPDRELRNARQELEDALADIPVGVDATGTDGTGGVGGGRSRDERPPPTPPVPPVPVASTPTGMSASASSSS